VPQKLALGVVGFFGGDGVSFLMFFDLSEYSIKIKI
jgi:hypothetical protein